MANWGNPVLTSTYANFLAELKDRDLDVAKMFDGVTITAPVSGMIKWNSTNKYWEKYNGTAWAALSTKYSIDVETVDGCTVNDSSAASASILWTSNKINTFASNYYTKAEIDTLKANYVTKNGENGTLTLGTNDASSVNIETNNIARLSIGGSGNVTIAAPASGVALSVTPFSGQNAISASGIIAGTVLSSTVATGTAPMIVTSTTKVANLNADYLDGYSATNANTANTIVQRDASGNFSAGTITASLSGNSTTATTLQTARSINNASFNGSANITVEPYIERDDTTNANRYITFVDDSTANYKRLNMDSNLYYNPSNNYIYANLSGTVSGNATTATTLQTARTINGVSFNGSANITIYDSTKAPLSSPALTGVPTAPTATAGTNTTQVATTAFVKAKSEADSIGVGQTWQDVTASRVLGTTYTNSTGKPIVVSYKTANQGNTNIDGYVDGIIRVSGNGYGGGGGLNFIVPNGSTYKFVIANTVTGFNELR